MLHKDQPSSPGLPEPVPELVQELVGQQSAYPPQLSLRPSHLLLRMPTTISGPFGTHLLRPTTFRATRPVEGEAGLPKG